MPRPSCAVPVRLAILLGLLVSASPVGAITITSGNPNQAAVSGTTAGVLSFGQTYDGINFGGVVEILSDISGTEYGCTGSLLTNGTSILTAGHCVLSGSGVLASSVTVDFMGPNGSISDPVSKVAVDPGFNGSNSTAGADLAILTLGDPAPSSAVEYQLYTGSEPIQTPLVIAGYGYGGTGEDGANNSSYPYGTLRVGTNEYEGDGSTEFSYDGSSYNLGYSSSLLIGQFYEFGHSSTNALGVTHAYHASDEVDISPGDSGGPSFYDDDGTYEIAGVHDLGVCLVSSSNSSVCEEPPAVGSANDSYYGDIFADVSVADNLPFIYDATGLPEPGTATMVICALGAVMGLRLRKRRV